MTIRTFKGLALTGLFIAILNLKIWGATYSLDFGEDLRSVAVKYGTSINVLDSLNPGLATNYALCPDPHQAIKDSYKKNVLLPAGAKLIKNPDSDVLASIFFENMNLFYSNELCRRSGGDTTRGMTFDSEGKRWYNFFLKRAVKDFGFETIKPDFAQSPTIVAAYYEVDPIAFEYWNPGPTKSWGKIFYKYDSRYGITYFFNPSSHYLEDIMNYNLIIPKGTEKKRNPELGKKLWSYNLGCLMWNVINIKGNPKGHPYMKWANMAHKAYRNEGLGAWDRRACDLSYLGELAFYIPKDPDYTLRFLKRFYKFLEREESDGTIESSFSNPDKAMELVWEKASRKQRIREQKKAERRARWNQFGNALVQAIGTTLQSMSPMGSYYGYNTPGYQSFDYSAMWSSSTSSNYGTANSAYMYSGNFNAGLNAAIITARSQQSLNDSWNQFQASMQNIRPYTWDELSNMSLNAFNAQTGLNFTQAEYDKALQSWSEQGARGSGIGGGYTGNAPSETSNDQEWQNYYINQYSRWERRCEDIYKSLTLFGSRTQSSDGSISGTVGDRGNAGGSTTSLKLNFMDAQKELRKIRQEASRKGISLSISSWETADVKL